MNGTFTGKWFRQSRSWTSLMTPLGYASDRLKVLEHERKALLDEQAKKEEQFRHLEEERQVMIDRKEIPPRNTRPSHGSAT